MVVPLATGLANCFLIRGKSGDVLVDTSVQDMRASLLQQLDGANIRLILLTHHHSDHIDNALAVSKATGAPIAMSRADWQAIERGASISFKYDNLFGFFAASMANGRPNRADFVPSVFLEDGMSLEQYGVDASVMLLPGHTPGSAGVLTADREFIAGDALMNFFHPTKARMFELPDMVLPSAKRALASGAKIIYAGHGKPFSPSEVKLK